MREQIRKVGKKKLKCEIERESRKQDRKNMRHQRMKIEKDRKM